MCKVFVEYTIDQENRLTYLYYMQKIIKQTGLELFEGTDQPGLFIEIWSDVNYTDYESMKIERLNPIKGSVWESFEDMILGGLSKLHIWHFSNPHTE
ncbi:hypothetical protein EHS13_07965 [Paenibacillus psychroresistens]|uniref:NIPSNAP domain-containing protein n=1 Tax=Paenibacillus psychroresistens TaxID=1778678 RepID=A0A6B8RHI2_9BACL|nr:hypothetical protein [Paenibacillus psychroresistens]QGQ94818.1 hypothetical protein EHS13_07965 [Paenibacillus psychroresistens]